MGGWGYHIVLIGIVLFFAVGTSVLSWSNARASDLSPRFHWPDETSNAYFAARVARGESLAVPEPRNLDAGNIIHPRTMNVRADGALVPGSYLGLPLWYGLIGRAVGERAMLFVAPILAAFGLLAFASLVRRLWNSIVAVVATIFLALHPSVWMFTATAMLPNVPFVALLLLGFMVLIGGRCWYRWATAGILIGLALTIRTHELLWVFALTAFTLLVTWRGSGGLQAATWRAEARRYTVSVVAVLVGIVIPFILILIFNSQLYGSPFITGYALLQGGGAAPTEFASSMLPSWLTALVAPFGWHPVEAFSRFWQYMIVSYLWFTVLAVIGLTAGLVSYARKLKAQSSKLKANPKSKFSKFDHLNLFWILDFGLRTSVRMIVGSIILTVWLILYYGSWTIADPLVRETNVLTISYVRYWLPIVVVLAPWAAAGLLAIAGRMPTQWRAHAIALVFLGIALTSFTKVVTDPSEGLLRQRQAIDEHRVRARAVIAATEPNAIIISHRMDKVFFPERAVVHATLGFFSPPLTEGEREWVGAWSVRGWGSETNAFLQNLRQLVDHAPVYWYAPGEIAIPGFTFESVGAMPFGEQLYHVE